MITHSNQFIVLWCYQQGGSRLLLSTKKRCIHAQRFGLFFEVLGSPKRGGGGLGGQDHTWISTCSCGGMIWLSGLAIFVFGWSGTERTQSIPPFYQVCLGPAPFRGANRLPSNHWTLPLDHPTGITKQILPDCATHTSCLVILYITFI